MKAGAVALVAGCMVTLAACMDQPPAERPPPLGFVAEGRVAPGDGPVQRFRLMRLGERSRLERLDANGDPAGIAIVREPAGGFALTQTETGAPLAMTFAAGRAPAFAEPAFETAQAAPDGACRHLGERGRAVRAPGDPRRACLSADGLLLKVEDAAGRVEWELTALDRTPPDPALFVIPEDAIVMDAAAVSRALDPS